MLILLSAVVVGLAGLILGVLIAMTAKKFAVETDPRIDSVCGMLPGANCGGCGYAGCADLAKAIALNNVSAGQCPASSDAARCAIDQFLGRVSEAKEKMVAVVLCSGSNHIAKRVVGYNGVLDCRSASLLSGGGKGCRFGCIGFGTCSHACKFGALEVVDGLAVVHPDRCVGCGRCAEVCPRKMIKMVPASVPVHVYCNSLQKPVMKRKNCAAACIACKKCVKIDETKMSSQGTLVRVNYSNPPDAGIVAQANCPSKCLCTPEEHLQMIRDRMSGNKGNGAA